MATTNSSALALAASLRALSDDALTALLHARPVKHQGIHDVFDLAEALLDAASIQAALSHLERTALSLLAAVVLAEEAPDAASVSAETGHPRVEVERTAAQLAALALLLIDEGRMVVPDAVARVLRSWPEQQLPSPEQLVHGTPPAALETVTSDVRAKADRVSGERAFAAVTAVGELVQALESEPARVLQRGGVALPDWRRLQAATGLDDEALATVLDIVERAGLAQASNGAWRPTTEARDWATKPRIRRWHTLATGWLAGVPDELRDQLRARAGVHWGDGLIVYLDWLYPAGSDWLPARIREVMHTAELLGVGDAGVPSTAGMALLTEGPDAASEIMQTSFPPDVRQVYIQHDLSVIAPGPLAADVDQRLRTVADVESAGLASSYRITAASVTRALTTGRSAEELRALLEEMSLTGIPQPLDYLLTETAERFGSLRVGAEDDTDAGTGPRSYVRADDPALIGQLVVDQTLAPLGLQRLGEHRAGSRFDAETVYWALVDARYPAVLEDGEGTIRQAQRPTATAPAAAAVTPDATARLVQRIRDAIEQEPAESGAAWNARQLELAIKAKLEVTVVVRMPNGHEAPYLLEPTALAGGRLRARDRRADIERTLPLSHIVAVEPAAPLDG